MRQAGRAISSERPTGELASEDKALGGEKPSRYRWAVVGAFWGMAEVASLVTMSIGVMLPSMTKDLAMTPSQSGMLGAVFWMAMALFSLPFSTWLSRYNPKRVITIAICLSAAFTIMQGWAPTFEVELVARAGFVVALVARGGVFSLIIQQWFAAREVPTVQGISSGLGNIAQTAAVALTPFWMSYVGGWRGALYTYGAMMLLSGLVWHIVGRERITPAYVSRFRSQEKTPLRSVVKYKELWLVGLGFLGGTIGWTAFFVFWPTFLLEERNIPLATGGVLMGLLPLGSMVGSFLCGFVNDKIGYKKPVICVTTALTIMARLGMVWFDDVLLLGAVAFLHGMLIFLIIPSMMATPYELTGIKPREIAVGTALISTIFNLGSVFGSLFVGFIYQATGTLFLALAICSLGSFAMFLPGIFLPETGWRARQKLEAASRESP